MLCNECIERKLREAGATTVFHGQNYGPKDGQHEAIIGSDGLCNVVHYGLTFPRAEAALRAATGKTDGTFIPEWLHNEKLAIKEAQLAAKDDEITRLSGEIAEAFDIINASWTQRCHKADVWLDRNKEA